MIEAPERIWVYPLDDVLPDLGASHGGWDIDKNDDAYGELTEYVRADALEALKRENEKLRRDVDWLHLQRETMHRRAQKAEGRLSRMTWWFERLLESAKVRRDWWMEKYASAALRNAKISTGTAYQLCHDIWRQEHSELENRHEALKRENEALRAMIRINAMRYHGMSHADIDAAIDAALNPTEEAESGS